MKYDKRGEGVLLKDGESGLRSQGVLYLDKPQARDQFRCQNPGRWARLEPWRCPNMAIFISCNDIEEASHVDVHVGLGTLVPSLSSQAS